MDVLLQRRETSQDTEHMQIKPTPLFINPSTPEASPCSSRRPFHRRLQASR